MFLLLIYFFTALVVSFLCSILEAVLLSITPSYIEALEQDGKLLGKQLKSLKNNIDRPLSAILSFNTIAHTIGAAGVGAQAIIVFGDAYLGIISIILTLLILVFSEIIPKSIGATYWRELASFSATVLNFMIIIIYPLVLLSQVITKIFSRKTAQAITSREEVSAMADIGQKEGVFEESESRIIKNLIRFKSIEVNDIMTPRTVVLAVSETLTLEEMFKHKKYLRFSRIPVYEGQIDNVTGYILKYDLLDKLANDQHKLTLKDIKREILVITENRPIPELFELLTEKREHVALVVDEYGGMSGIATMEDVLETLLGLEIVDEFDHNVDMQQYAREKWKARASRLGILTDENKDEDKNDDMIIKSKITGGVAPGTKK